MKTLLLSLTLPVALALSACGPGGGMTGGTDAGGDLCLASTWRDRFVGTPSAQARAEVAPLVREGRARIIEAGQSASGPSYDNRLTFEIGRNDTVSRIYCG